MPKEKKSFIFNCEWQEVLMEYPAEVRLEVYDAIIRYVASGTLSELKPLAKMAFSFIKKEIDYNESLYLQKVEARSKAGKKGMKARYEQQNLTNPTNVTKPNKTNKEQQNLTNPTNVTEYDNDNIYISSKEDNIICEFSESKNEPDILTELELQFDTFRKSYPGQKSGLKTEFANFKKKNPANWKEIIPLLSPALSRLKGWREKAAAAGMFVPEYKYLSTWLNHRCWEDEYPEIPSVHTQAHSKPAVQGNKGPRNVNEEWEDMQMPPQ